MNETIETAPATTPGRQAVPPIRPMLTEEDEKGWIPLGRGKGQPGRVKVTASFNVSLDSATAKWAEREATAAGTDIFTYLASLVTQAKARQEATQEGAETE